MSAPPFRFALNRRQGTPGMVVLPASGFLKAKAEITSWANYAPTPLRDLSTVADRAEIGAVWLKDEAERFGLGSFKALGGAYAVAKLLVARGGAPTTVVCATDGNHGRAVAWGAQRVGAACIVLVHARVSQARVDAIARYGAEVRRVAGNYDDAVREVARLARDEGWFVVSDTSWPGYTSVPIDVMQGYRLMADEAADQWTGPSPTHVFIQAGVGGVAAAVSVQMRARFTPHPVLVVVEADQAACLLDSLLAGRPATVQGDLDTIMAGLACGEPSMIAWQELERSATAFMAIPDAVVPDAMRLLAALGIVSGESGVAGLAALLLAAQDPDARRMLDLGPDSRVLLFSTEGATDPELYRRLTD